VAYGLPPLPAGYTLVTQPPARPRRSPRPADSDLPPLPAGYTLETNPQPVKGEVLPPLNLAQLGTPTGQAHDGDTFALTSGRNARLLGVDAFELAQPQGPAARDYLQGRLPGGVPSFAGSVTYGRPVVTLNQNGSDVGEGSVSAGLALPEPKYLGGNPQLLDRYVSAQRDAIANERGAYAGQYQRPDDYRHLGPTAAPMVGKLPMSPIQAREYSGLLHNPKTTPAELEAWAMAQGQPMTNAANILSMVRKNPGAKLSTYFQQRDVMQTPVQKAGQPLPVRLMGSLNEGIADTLGAPVDLVNAGLGAIGVPVSDRPFLGSQQIRDAMHGLGIGQINEGYAPRSTAERYGQAFTRGIGQATLPIAGQMTAGTALALRAPFAFTLASPARTAIRTALTDSAAAPRALFAGELSGAVGSQLAGQAGEDYAPGNMWVQLGTQTLGGLAGGFAGAVGARARLPGRPTLPNAPHALPEAPAGRFDGVVSDAAPFPTPQSANNGPAWAGAAPDVPPPPPGYRIVEAYAGGPDIPPPPPGYRVQNMDAEHGPASISAPAAFDETGAPLPPLPEGYTLAGPMGRARPMLDQLSAEELVNRTKLADPRGFRPRPSSEVTAADRDALTNASYPVTQPVDERSLLPSRTLNGRTRRNPVDLVTYLRGGAGLIDDGGELASVGITNAPRNLDFAKDEGFAGRLLAPKGSSDGMSLDDAAVSAWEAGYFPELPQPPTRNEFLNALADTHSGHSRRFHPDDWAAIDDYYGAQGFNEQIAKQAQAGSPLVDEVGQPATFADIEANRTPAAAYEDAPSRTGKVGNINLANLNSREDIAQALKATEQHYGGFDAARRGTISHEETARLASELGMTPDDLLRRRKGQALNAEEAYAARSILAKSSDEIVKLAAKADGGSHADLNAFHTALLRHAAIHEQVSAATTEAARALSQFRAMADSNAVSGRIHKLMLEGAGGREHLDGIAKGILELQAEGIGPAGVNKFAVKAVTPRFWDKLTELYYNVLLSGPQTHVVNVTSNALTSLLQLPEHAGAAAIGLGRSAVSNAADRVYLAELGARAYGMIQGAQEGLAAAARTMKTGKTADLVTKVEGAEDAAISGLKGKVIRLPTRALSSEDEFFKAVARRSELAGLAVRQARKEMLTGAKAKARVDDLIANPPDDMFQKSLDYARYVTFQQPATGLASVISQATKKFPPLKFVVPFVRTPANIFKFAAERSPAAPLIAQWRKDIAAGGARRDLAIARMTMGTGLGALMTLLAKEGYLTGGGPTDENAKSLMMADGWKPYSFKVGDRYYSYQRLDPLATTIGTAADLATNGDYMTEAQREDAAVVLAASISSNLQNKTWLSGVEDAVKAATDPWRYGEAYARKMIAGATVSALVNQTARTIDPTMRETPDILSAVQARIPFASRSLLPKLDVWGSPITNEGGLGPDFVSPIWTGTARRDPVNSEMLAIGARFGDPSRTVGGRKLTDTEFNSYRALAGRETHGLLADAIKFPGWKDMAPEDREALADKLKRLARSNARAALFGGPLPKSPPPSDIPPPPPGYTLQRPVRY
jgi:endonuclease YncB( thermonuclease family)